MRHIQSINNNIIGTSIISYFYANQMRWHAFYPFLALCCCRGTNSLKMTRRMNVATSAPSMPQIGTEPYHSPIFIILRYCCCCDCGPRNFLSQIRRVRRRPPPGWILWHSAAITKPGTNIYMNHTGRGLDLPKDGVGVSPEKGISQQY